MKKKEKIRYKIIKNMIQCKKCNDIIESIYRHDFRYCKCFFVAVDGGHDYLRRMGTPNDYKELSIMEEIK